MEIFREDKSMKEVAGYIHPLYANSLREFGEPRELPHCGGWILERPIPGTPYKDAMGCYPLFTCRDWSRFHEDLEEIGTTDLVSLVLVTDPFADVDQAYLERCLQIVKPFKKHLVVDLSQNIEHFVNKHHRYHARKSLRDIKVEICDQPVRYADEWIKLYDNLIKKHNISGIRAFSKESLYAQLQTPGVVLVLGRLAGQVEGGHIIVTHDNVAYSHLAASSDAGYKHCVSYAIYWETLNFLAEHGIEFLDLGAAAGVDENTQDGLTWFKAGWSNAVRIVYFCGQVFDDQVYETICRQKHINNTDYFPSYRMGEFY